MRLAPAVAASLALAALAPAQAAYFRATGGGYGASVTVTEDGCTASILLDDASVSEERDLYEVGLPLVIVGRADVTVQANGFAMGQQDAASMLGANGGETTFYERDGDNGNWFRSFSMRSRGKLELRMEAYGYSDGEPFALSVDSLDFTIANCGR